MDEYDLELRRREERRAVEEARRRPVRGLRAGRAGNDRAHLPRRRALAISGSSPTATRRRPRTRARKRSSTASPTRSTRPTCRARGRVRTRTCVRTHTAGPIASASTPFSSAGGDRKARCDERSPGPTGTPLHPPCVVTRERPTCRDAPNHEMPVRTSARGLALMPEPRAHIAHPHRGRGRQLHRRALGRARPRLGRPARHRGRRTVRRRRAADRARPRRARVHGLDGPALGAGRRGTLQGQRLRAADRTHEPQVARLFDVSGVGERLPRRAETP